MSLVLAPKVHGVSPVAVVLIARHVLVLGGGLLWPWLRGDSVSEAELRVAGRACDERAGVAAFVDLSRVAVWVGAASEVGHVSDGLVDHVGQVSGGILCH